MDVYAGKTARISFRRKTTPALRKNHLGMGNKFGRRQVPIFGIERCKDKPVLKFALSCAVFFNVPAIFYKYTCCDLYARQVFVNM